MLGLAGCGEGTPASPSQKAPPSVITASPFPPRPAELRLGGVDPCALLKPAQIVLLQVDDGEPSQDSDSTHSAVCFWGNRLAAPDTSYLARLYVGQGADYALGSETGHQIAQIDGFAAVQTAAAGEDPKTHCLLFVDVAQGQSLSVLYVNRRGDYPGISHEVACRLARDAAGLMVQNLRAMAH